MSLIYIVFGRFNKLSFYRQDQYVRPNAKIMTVITEQINQDIAHFVRHKGRKRRSDLSPAAKVCIFIFCSVGIIFGVAVYLFLSLLQKTFFNVLIGWKGLNLGSLSLMFAKFLSLIEQLTVAVFPNFLLVVVLYPLALIYELAEFFNIDMLYSLLTVTCQGAKAPIELFIDSFVLGIAVLFIKSNYCVLWSVSLQQMNRSVAIKYWIEDKKILSAHFILSAGAFLLTATNPFISILRFFLSFVNFGAFFADHNVTHYLSPACVGIAGFENQELWLVDATSVLVWWLIAPMLYLTAEIVCPRGGYTTSKISLLNTKRVSIEVSPLPAQQVAHDKNDWEEDSSLGSFDISDMNSSDLSTDNRREGLSNYDIKVEEEANSFISSRVVSSPTLHSKVSLPVNIENEELRHASQVINKTPERSPRQLSTTFLAISGALRYSWSYSAIAFSADLFVVYMIQAWVGYCQKTNHLQQLRQRRSHNRWNAYNVESAINQFHHEHVKASNWNRYITFFSNYEKAEIEANSERTKKWYKIVHEPDLPPFYKLCFLEAQELQASLSSVPFLRLLSAPLTYFLVLASFGHILTAVGRQNWAVVIRKYALFMCVSVGFWTDEAYEAYEVKELLENFSYADPDEVTMQLIQLVISSRAILLQALGGTTTLISIAIINMCGSPLFVFSPKMLENIPPLIHFNARQVALKRERAEQLGLHHSELADQSIVVEEWAINMWSAGIFLTESRLLVFFANLVSLILSIIILEGYELSSGYVAMLLFCILPFLVGSSLIPIMYLGKRLHLSDDDFVSVGLGWLLRKEIVRTRDEQPRRRLSSENVSTFEDSSADLSSLDSAEDDSSDRSNANEGGEVDFPFSDSFEASNNPYKVYHHSANEYNDNDFPFSDSYEATNNPYKVYHHSDLPEQSDQELVNKDPFTGEFYSPRRDNMELSASTTADNRNFISYSIRDENSPHVFMWANLSSTSADDNMCHEVRLRTNKEEALYCNQMIQSFKSYDIQSLALSSGQNESSSFDVSLDSDFTEDEKNEIDVNDTQSIAQESIVSDCSSSVNISSFSSSDEDIIRDDRNTLIRIVDNDFSDENISVSSFTSSSKQGNFAGVKTLSDAGSSSAVISFDSDMLSENGNDVSDGHAQQYSWKIESFGGDF